METLWILLIPFAGTALGSACVYFLRDGMGARTEQALSGFAAGVMVAASIWSLLIPAMNQASDLGKWAFIPAVVGFWAGMMFLFILDHAIPHMHNHGTEDEGPKSKLKRSTKLVLAITLHNIPEGMAVGATYAGWMTGSASISMSGALALAIGIAVQNFPEGAIVSMPLVSCGTSRNRSFLYGMLSGIVEPAAAFVTILLTGVITPVLPYLLAFAEH